MIAFTTNERLALLLSVLGEEAATTAFQAMHPTRATYLRKLLNEFKSDPPSAEEVDYVIGDFNQYFQFAMQTWGPEIDQANSQVAKKTSSKSTKSPLIYFPKLTPTNDPIADLNRLDPFQIAQAIADDHPKTVALVLRNIDTKQAAKILELLSTEVRNDAIVFMTRDSTVTAPIVNQVLKSTVQKAVSVEFRAEEVDQSQVLADLMRSLPKTIRVELMVQLEESDLELAQKVKSKLYSFEDLLRLDDRDIQKLLAEVETDSLIVSLQRCDQVLIDRLLKNLSKRARESIIEEMEFKIGVSDEELEASRSKLVAALARLDDSGQIKMT